MLKQQMVLFPLCGGLWGRLHGAHWLHGGEQRRRSLLEGLPLACLWVLLLADAVWSWRRRLQGLWASQVACPLQLLLAKERSWKLLQMKLSLLLLLLLLMYVLLLLLMALILLLACLLLQSAGVLKLLRPTPLRRSAAAAAAAAAAVASRAAAAAVDWSTAAAGLLLLRTAWQELQAPASHASRKGTRSSRGPTNHNGCTVARYSAARSDLFCRTACRLLHRQT
jgi:hypothetical protein